jgi:pimeloyl-ACP methyl ester carboxylesterase
MDQRSRQGQTEQLEIIEAGPPGGATGRPLLFVHGAFAGAWCWSEFFLPYFAGQGFRACAVSLRGHGGSPGRELLAFHSIANYVEDLQQAVEAVGEDPILIGHSMGGFVIQKYLESTAAPAVVLMASVPPQGLLPATFTLALSNPGLFSELNDLVQSGRVSLETVQQALFGGPVALDALQAFCRQIQPESQRAIWDMSLYDLPQLWRMRCPPILVLGAERDTLVPPAQTELAARFYSTQAEIFPGMGHVMMLEAGWQKVADRIIEWVKALQLA